MAAADTGKALDACLEKLSSQLDAMKSVYPRFPHAYSGGEWKTSGDAEWQQLIDGYWTGGFWVGQLFIAHRLTGDEDFYYWGRRWLNLLRPRAEVRSMHDLGFLFFPSSVAGVEFYGEKDFMDTAITAASNLASRYSRRYRCITIFEREPLDRTLAVDTMMNLPLLWWAGKRTGNEMWLRIADNHLRTTAQFALRDDGSTNHIVRFEAGAREVEEVESWQGDSAESCWARGQAWMIAGLAYALLFTRNDEYREMLELPLHYFGTHLPSDVVPCWDLDVDTGIGEPRDASALAIAAHALILLKGWPELRQLSRPWIDALVNNCAAPADTPGLLEHVCFHKPQNLDTDCSCMFADFYYLLALANATGRLEGPCISGF